MIKINLYDDYSEKLTKIVNNICCCPLEVQPITKMIQSYWKKHGVESESQNYDILKKLKIRSKSHYLKVHHIFLNMFSKKFSQLHPEIEPCHCPPPEYKRLEEDSLRSHQKFQVLFSQDEEGHRTYALKTCPHGPAQVYNYRYNP